MQNQIRNSNPSRSYRTVLQTLSIALLGLSLQACQTYQLSPEEWNARTNAVNAFGNSVNNWNQSQRPVYRQPAQVYQYQPVQYYQPQPVYQAPQSTQQPLFGQGSLFNQ